MTKTTKKVRTKKELDVLRDYGFRLFMGGALQKDIAARLGVTENTVSRWAKEEKWDDKRRSREKVSPSAALVNSLTTAARTVSEKLIVMLSCDELTEIGEITKLSDNISKLISSAHKMSKNYTRDDVIDMEIDYEHWLAERAQTDAKLTPELISVIHYYHQKYIEHLSVLEE